jgi:hypothetical protein
VSGRGCWPWPSARGCKLASADLFGQGDDDARGAAEVAEPEDALVLRHLAKEFGAPWARRRATVSSMSSQTGRAESVETNDRRAAAIWGAITKKSTRIPPRQRAQLVLVLDAIRTPGYLRSAVFDVFRVHYADQARNMGYIAIWLVGPTATLTRQLS